MGSHLICVRKELRLGVEVTRILDTWAYEITPEVRLPIVTYGCQERTHRAPVLNHEHKQLGWFPVREVAGLLMPHGNKQSIAHWSRLLGLRVRNPDSTRHWRGPGKRQMVSQPLTASVELNCCALVLWSVPQTFCFPGPLSSR